MGKAAQASTVSMILEHGLGKRTIDQQGGCQLV